MTINRPECFTRSLKLSISLLLTTTVGLSQSQLSRHGHIIVNPKDNYSLAFEDGTPFFWLADTGWELIHALTKEETSYYLKTRKQQGFNVVQSVLISEFDGLTRPNAYGQMPFVDRNPEKPALKSKADAAKYDYWDHVAYVIAEADKQGIVMALLPCWGEYVVPREHNQIFKTPEQAYNYGNFLGKRFGRWKNLVWILGGDRLPDEIPDGIAMWRAMAKGLADGTNGTFNPKTPTDYSTTFMTYHCSVSSSRWFQNDAWLDFNMWGSYHDNYGATKAFEQVYADRKVAPQKPTLNGEPAYEMHPVNWLEGNGTFVAYDVRQIAYWSVIAGACGHTYGCNPVWQFYDTLRPLHYFANVHWKDALNAPGASQLIHLKNLLYSRPLAGKSEANDIIVNGPTSDNDKTIALKGDGFVFCYLPTGRPVNVALPATHFDSAKAWWYNPRDGKAISIGDFNSAEAVTFTPPGISATMDWLKSGRGCDWVLVIDDAKKGFSAPGTSTQKFD